jgi:hypothetical protein
VQLIRRSVFAAEFTASIFKATELVAVDPTWNIESLLGVKLQRLPSFESVRYFGLLRCVLIVATETVHLSRSC